MRLILALSLLLSATACKETKAEAEKPEAVTAKGRAIDGDTISIDIRLFGADAFERHQLCRKNDGCWPCGKAAQDYASRLLKDGAATIRLTSKQSYGRPIGTVEIAGKDLGETMIRAGLAVPAVQYLQDDPTRARRYVAAYDEAVASRAGVHRGYFMNPAKWRHGARLSCETDGRNDNRASIRTR